MKSLWNVIYTLELVQKKRCKLIHWNIFVFMYTIKLLYIQNVSFPIFMFTSHAHWVNKLILCANIVLNLMYVPRLRATVFNLDYMGSRLFVFPLHLLHRIFCKDTLTDPLLYIYLLLLCHITFYNINIQFDILTPISSYILELQQSGHIYNIKYLHQLY